MSHAGWTGGEGGGGGEGGEGGVSRSHKQGSGQRTVVTQRSR